MTSYEVKPYKVQGLFAVGDKDIVTALVPTKEEAVNLANLLNQAEELKDIGERIKFQRSPLLGSLIAQKHTSAERHFKVTLNLLDRVLPNKKRGWRNPVDWDVPFGKNVEEK